MSFWFLAISTTPRIQWADDTRSLSFWLDLRHPRFMTPAPADWVNSVCQVVFNGGKGTACVRAHTFPGCYPNSCLWCFQDFFLIISPHSRRLHRHKTLTFAYRITQQIPSTHLFPHISGKSEAARLSLWKGWLGFLIWHMDTKLQWRSHKCYFSSTPKTEKGTGTDGENR